MVDKMRIAIVTGGSLINWLIAADVMPKEEREAIRRTYNQAFGIDVNDAEQARAARVLPEPVANGWRPPSPSVTSSAWERRSPMRSTRWRH